MDNNPQPVNTPNPQPQPVSQPVKPPNNLAVAPLILLEIITLVVAGYFGYQTVLLKGQLEEVKNTPTQTPVASEEASPTPSAFLYSYMTPDEFRTKLTTALIEVNKGNPNYSIESQKGIIDTSIAEYQGLDNFTKWVFSTCPSTFAFPNAGTAVTVDNSFTLPFTIEGTYKIQCVGAPLVPKHSYFSVNLSSINFGASAYAGLFFIMGYKATAGDLYGVIASEVLQKIDTLTTINGAQIEVTNRAEKRNDTGELVGYSTFIYAYKKLPDFLVASLVVLNEKTNDNFNNLDLSQYPNINADYKTVIDQLTQLTSQVKPI